MTLWDLAIDVTKLESEAGLEIDLTRSQTDGENMTQIDSTPAEHEITSIEIYSIVARTLIVQVQFDLNCIELNFLAGQC